MGFRWTGIVPARHERGVLAFLAFALCWLGGSPALAAAITGIALSADRLAIRFDAPVASASARLTTDPRRLVVSLPDTAPGRPTAPFGIASAVRQVRRAGATRVELDLTRPVTVADGSFERDGRELVIKLKQADAPAFVAASLAGPLDFFPFNLRSFSRSPRIKLSIPVPARARSAALPRVSGEEGRPLVVIDAGHGGFDPGAVSPTSGLREKDVTLRIAQAIRDDLVASGRVRVALTRDDDRYLVLRERFGIARRLRADLFISIHCDSTGTQDASGASVYTLSEVASDKEAARLAARENKADVIQGVNLGEAGSDVSSILIDLTQRETMNASATFARLLWREAKPLIPVKPVFHRMASLMVLKAPDMPSILFETGYISNPADAGFLDSNGGRERIAGAVRRAVEANFARRMAAR
ncbi:N-acetylmuramoyl-L-alanine amidase [Sphingomonas aerophila]|uniref:N-acetylmuramoyl-L-alanine amidase n=1 Tax=Sphingomonas aerophila TaxID=1344948 RepID=A0A7W9BBL7_9SPHN|nr:N-acetylmuramoyl-L-alanine amidase [Sphingomonas aerophila]MBB5714234.1 N-acetylmuramoyl-L-alanine amidase [Sphingomonas aerophila]